jgi:hypothetical protein
MGQKYSKYRVEPFSGGYFRNQSRIPKGKERCAICGNPTNRSHVAIVINGGTDWGDENSPQNSAFMGEYYVGSNCHRKYVVR